MPCATVPTPTGFAFVCSRSGGVHPCVVCGRVATKQCDYPRKPRPSRARCNAHMCDDHAVHVGEDLDWCWPCAEADATAGAVCSIETCLLTRPHFHRDELDGERVVFVDGR